MRAEDVVFPERTFAERLGFPERIDDRALKQFVATLVVE